MVRASNLTALKAENEGVGIADSQECLLVAPS
jgi:hypothetical protein